MINQIKLTLDKAPFTGLTTFWRGFFSRSGIVNAGKIFKQNTYNNHKPENTNILYTKNNSF